MFTVESGLFYPDLENAFRNRVLELKKDPFTPLIVIAPSGRILERLQTLLAALRPAFMNIHFHTFSSLAEQVVEREGGLKKPVLSDPLFFDTLVKFIIKSDRPFRSFADMAIPDGFPMAVRATLRDLMDSGAPASIIEAVGERFLGRDVDVGSLKQLLHLYRLYLEKLDTLPVLPRFAVIKAATEAAPASAFLKSFREILFYGFYDATGVQTDFFHAIVKNHPSRLFFPYQAHNPAYKFAGRFRDTFLQPVVGEEIVLASDEKAGEVPFEIMNISGLRDEAAVIARKIRAYHDDEKIPFSQIAVVARSRERLGDEFPHAFDELSIPYFTSAEQHLSDVPVYRFIVDALEKESANWPGQAAWSAYNQRAEKVLRDTACWATVEEPFKQMHVFLHLGKKVSREDYLDVLQERLGRSPLLLKKDAPKGVALLHAEAMRGLSFQVVILAGVEEKVFPRIIREDPFLRDDARAAISNTIGYKISQKLSAHEEEALLFEILTRSARDKLLFTYQRSDDEGAIVGPSPFLRAWLQKQNLVLDAKTVLTVPRSYRDKLKEMSPAAAPMRDLVTAGLMNGQKAEALALAASMTQALPLSPRLDVQAQLQMFSPSGPHDGEVGPQNVKQLSVTDFEVFGRCPFQYFVTRVLDIDPDEMTASKDQVPPVLRGKLAHRFFEAFFKEATQDGTAPLPKKWPAKLFAQVFDEVFNEEAAAEAVVWPVIWLSFLASMKGQLQEILQADLASLAGGNFQPVYFETKMRGQLPAPLDGIEWVGKVDRIDVAGDVARIVDYKSGSASKETVVSSSLKGLRGQPSLYLLLCEAFFKEKKKPLAGASFVYRYLKSPEAEEELSWETWQEYKPELLKTFGVQLGALKAGRFPIMPDNKYCAYCGVLAICRKNDSLSAYRSEQGAADLWELRKKRK